MFPLRTVLTLAAVACAAAAAPARAQGPLTNAFTYQGELRQGGNPANGLYDMRFRLYDALAGGVQQGSTQCADNVILIDGHFTAPLDFGAQFNGQRRFLEIEVRPDPGTNCTTGGGYVLLSPRQELTGVPYSHYALSTAAAATAGNATQLNGQAAAFYTNAANLSAGTIPSDRLGGAYTGALTFSNASNAFTGSGAGLTNIPWSGITGAPPTIGLQGSTPGSAEAGNLHITGAGLFGDKVGIGTAAPLRPLHVVNSNTFIARFENSNIFTAVTEFRNSASNTTWELDVGGTSPPFALPAGTLYFRPTSVAESLLSIDPAGNVGIKKLSANSTTVNATAVFANGSSANTTGVYGRGTAYGVFAAGLGPYGLYGEANIAAGNYGVFASGNLGSNGTKSFRIDHPTDPENKYLLHYSIESPEVLNVYSGKVTLDALGRATVALPDYFAAINTDPRYTLTAIGAAMPALHIEREIDDAALAEGNATEPGRAIPDCDFSIAGGAPGGKVSWRIEAVRNDRWMQVSGAPVETIKPESERGHYQRPELYGQPAERGMPHPSED